MATNPYISQSVRSEQNLYEDIVIESLKFYGQDVYYLPREIINKDKIFVDDIPSRFSDAYKIEMYIENVEGFEGEGDLFTKFGIELRDQATFVVARRRWKNLIGKRLEEANFRPREGDLIYLPLSHSIFQIMKVETETPFYQLSQLPTFRMQCELFEYNDEDFDTDIDEIDDVEFESAFQYKLTMATPAEATAAPLVTLDSNGSIAAIANSGLGYSFVPSITISDIDSGFSKFGRNSLDASKGRYVNGKYTRTDISGLSEFFVYVNAYPTGLGKAAFFETGGNDSAGKNQKFIFGVDYNGYLVSSRYDNNGDSAQIFTGAQMNTQTWHHLMIGNDSTSRYIYFDGIKIFESDYSYSLQDLTDDGYKLGGDSRNVDGEFWQRFNGRMDEFRTVLGEKEFLLNTRYTGSADSAIAVPTAELDSDLDTVALDHLSGRIASISATLDSSTGALSFAIDSGGIFYNTAPTITVAAPYTDSNFTAGEILTQINPTYTIRGEVTKWSDSDNILQLAHVGSTDGKFHTFSTAQPLVGTESGAKRVPTLVEELQEIQQEAQNSIFDDFEGDFLDFSESNPFGDMS